MRSRMAVFFGEFCLLALLLSSFLGFANVRASTDQDQQQVPAPQIRTFTDVTGYPGGAYDLNVQQGDLGEIFFCRKSSDPNNTLNLCWVGNIFYNVSGTLYDFQYILGSSAHFDFYSFPADAYGRLGGVYFNCSGELLPLCLCNCSSFDMVTSNVTYVGTVPTFTNTVTFHDIPLETFGLSNSSVTIVFIQNFTADWTLLTVKTDVYADLTNLKLYLSNGTEVATNTSYSLNFDYGVGLEKEDANGTSATPILPSEITSTSVYFNINSTRGNFSNADMSLGDTYDEFQGNTTVPGKNATAHFISVLTGEGKTTCHCIQTFGDLTYGLTTGIKSDPTIHVQHARVPVFVTAGSGIIVLAIAGIATVAILVIGVAVVHTRKKRALTSARADETQKQAENENPGPTCP